MKLKSLYLKNFRAYKNIEVDFDDDLNVIIGQNDIGKSTILEALDIFFGEEVIKIESSDLNINSDDNKIIIGCKFQVNNDFELVIDVTNKTSLKEEFLLNGDGYLDIYKVFEVDKERNKIKKPNIFIKAFYPKCFSMPLINLKIKDLKDKLKEIKDDIDNYNEVNKSKSADIRKAIYKFQINKNTEFSLIDIDLQKEDGKNIWNALQKELPLYFLFQSDRQNKDSDGDIQNPLKSATKQIIATVEDKFEELKQQIEKELEKIGNETIAKMKDMGLEIAKDLKPVVNNKSWDSLFSFTLESDNGIPLNKRGSGFRRMVLLNYFRAEAERKANEKNNKNIIYAFEEPETAQHPNHQKILIDSLIKLSEKENYQIILTTHTPEIAKMVNENNLIVIVNSEEQPIIVNEEDDKLDKVISTLGVLPSLDIESIQKIKVLVCVEGYTDIEFLKNINKIEEYQNIIDLNGKEVGMLFLGGSTLEHYVNKKYLDKLGIPQVHIYDSDINQPNPKNRNKYKKIIDRINKRQKQFAFETQKAELENYIHPEIIKKYYEFDTIYHLGEKDWLKKWSEEIIMEKYVKENKKNSKTAKKADFANLSKKITKEHLIELEAFNEIKKWFEKIRELSEL